MLILFALSIVFGFSIIILIFGLMKAGKNADEVEEKILKILLSDSLSKINESDTNLPEENEYISSELKASAYK